MLDLYSQGTEEVWDPGGRHCGAQLRRQKQSWPTFTEEAVSGPEPAGKGVYTNGEVHSRGAQREQWARLRDVESLTPGTELRVNVCTDSHHSGDLSVGRLLALT